ncbi:hypothetical protein Cgig2_012830 [Carnegiea gigantea]|uniref:Uncharacterized protein n=1 Tax=Carnegiea gigantea TaxID=171969 RepID=A0A9Q1K8P6_9CARY|nr:hypothetical protein Cgig2_012830 [Carnegiea gigantea]
MAFLRSLSTKEMAKYVVRHFAWDRCGAAFPQSPLPKDFQALCPGYELAVAEEAAEDYELPELPQAIFYTMLLNEAERLGVLNRRALRMLELALTEFHWSTFESWVWLYGDQIFEVRFRTKAAPEESSGAGLQEEGSEVEPEGEGSANEGAAYPFDDDKQGNTTGDEGRQRTIGTPIFPFIIAFPPLYNTREMADYVRESFIWRWRGATRPPHPLPEDYHILCPRFSLPEAEGAATDFDFPEMVQATFYAMLLNFEVHGFMAEGLRSALVGLRWSNFEVWMSRVDYKLREAQLRQQAVEGEVRGPSDGREESSGSNGPPPPSSDRSSLSLVLGFLLTSHFPLRARSEKREKSKMNLFPNFTSTEQAAEYSLRDPSTLGPRPLPSDYHGLCPCFDLEVATRYARDSNIPEMVQIIFYAMVIDDAT